MSAPERPWDGFTAALVERPENMNFCRVARAQPDGRTDHQVKEQEEENEEDV